MKAGGRILIYSAVVSNSIFALPTPGIRMQSLSSIIVKEAINGGVGET